MPNPLDLIWRAYGITLDAFGVVRRSLSIAAPERTAVLQGSQFAKPASNQNILDALDAAQEELDDQTVMFLYATFEATLRDHVTDQAPLLATSTHPGPQFGPNLEAWFTEFCKETRMDRVITLFEPWATSTGIAQAGTIRKYRHWLAHGKRGAAPPSVLPQFAYKLTDQLSEVMRPRMTNSVRHRVRVDHPDSTERSAVVAPSSILMLLFGGLTAPSAVSRGQ